jgi:hypothetical protein
MHFTAHNIELADGRRTIDGQPLLSDGQPCRAVLRTINAIWRPRERSAVRLADLGCLEGGYSVQFARHGYDVLGMEVRRANIEKCLWVGGNAGLPNLRFAGDDVRNIASYGQFDAVFCCGLLYHLDRPCELLQTLGRITSTALVLQTHFATGAIPRSAWRSAASKAFQPVSRLWSRLRRVSSLVLARAPNRKVDYMLSRLQQNEGRWGRWYYEYPPLAPQAEVEEKLWASYGNFQSFWLHKKELLQVTREAGFDIIYEQYDFLDDIVRNSLIEDQDRGMFVALKSAALPARAP